MEIKTQKKLKEDFTIEEIEKTNKYTYMYWIKVIDDVNWNNWYKLTIKTKDWLETYELDLLSFIFVWIIKLIKKQKNPLKLFKEILEHIEHTKT